MQQRSLSQASEENKYQKQRQEYFRKTRVSATVQSKGFEDGKPNCPKGDLHSKHNQEGSTLEFDAFQQQA